MDEKHYKTKLLKEEKILQEMFQNLFLLENTITFSLSDDSIKIINGNVGEEIIEDDLVLPIINNLRMRKTPSLSGEIIGYMEDKIYRIIALGEEEEIEGINGNWIMIKPHDSNDVSWVFSGFTRKPTTEEIDRFLVVKCHFHHLQSNLLCRRFLSQKKKCFPSNKLSNIFKQHGRCVDFWQQIVLHFLKS